LIDVFATDQKSLRASDKHDSAVADRFSGRADTLDRKIEFVEAGSTIRLPQLGERGLLGHIVNF
jgi:hypothetical protein